MPDSCSSFVHQEDWALKHNTVLISSPELWASLQKARDAFWYIYINPNEDGSLDFASVSFAREFSVCPQIFIEKWKKK